MKFENRADLKSCRGFSLKRRKKDGHSFCCKLIGAAPLILHASFSCEHC
ncbi:hypothetical protein HMPREF9443_00751 [Phascolarctobacterium succinatutens YIT 12067]|uniref:Uncharacterized protein n=1 Tax=Phascolarctobacterium succinatutens YIT 12067 TaxID=626939 RepID=E8LD27_9FIRM|nr:hypothetical protein HMPREF9443_00751 [Phascolarctobacterium succinatutens YIT 12067]